MKGIRASGLGVVLVVAALAFAPAAGASTIFYASSSLNFNAGSIWSVNSDGSGARQLRSKLPEGPGGVVASVSRDGKHLFCLCRGTEIDSMKLDGSGFKKVGDRPTRIKYDYTVLGPEGDPFWFQGAGLMTASRNGKHERLVVKGSFEEELAIPQRGRRIAISGGDTLFTTSLDGGPLTKIYHSAYPGFREIGEMSWSADGKKLVFVDYPETEKYEEPPEPASHAFLYAGGVVRELPLSPEALYGPPTFSPDGTQLASLGGEGSIFLSSLRGGPGDQIAKRKCSELCIFRNRLLGWVP
jgi:WD40-like Beta Propeller Repeat